MKLEVELGEARRGKEIWVYSQSNSSSESTRALAELAFNARLLEDVGSTRTLLSAKDVQVKERESKTEESKSATEGLEEDVGTLEGEARRVVWAEEGRRGKEGVGWGCFGELRLG